MSTNSFLIHQKSILTYMFRVVPEQKGLIVAHYMGTGKTITAIGFLMQYLNSNYKLTVVHPQGLKYIWQIDSKKLGVENIINSIEFFSYEDFFIFLDKDINLSNRVVVFDEAHKLSGFLESMAKEISIKYFDKIKTIHRILLLTGTPIYNNEYDLRWLINIAAGKSVVPLNKKEFDKEYIKAHIPKSIIFQWTIPFITKVLPGILILDLFPTILNIISVWYYGNFSFNNIDSLISLISIISYYNKILQESYLSYFIDLGLEIPTGLQEMLYTLNKTFKEYGYKVSLKDIPEYVLKVLTNFGSFIIAMIFIYNIYIISDNIYPKTFYDFNVQKFINNCGKYISFYDLPNNSVDPNSKFPTIKNHIMKVSYTSGQLQVWAAITMRSSDITEVIKILPPNMSEEAYRLTGHKYLEHPEDWVNYGRIIGNLTEHNEIPKKFIEVLKTIKSAGMKKTIVYSNFWEQGCLLFAKYLDSISIKYEFITPFISEQEDIRILKDFEEDRCPIIILHPDKTEGVSFKGVKQLHILEPLLSYAKQQQLVARVNRYESHIHLPINERKVDVYFWCASLENIYDWFRKHKASMKQWFLKEMNMNYFNRTLDFTQDATPDFLAMQNTKELHTLIYLLKEKTEETSDAIILKTKNKKECCLWEPNEKQIQTCLANYGKMCI